MALYEIHLTVLKEGGAEEVSHFQNICEMFGVKP